MLSLSEGAADLRLPQVVNCRPDRKMLARYRKAVRRDLLTQLPPVAVGHALVQFDMENVAWMHCCYHGPTFSESTTTAHPLTRQERETDLFWAALGSDDVEINWSFLALLFGVLMSAAYHLPPDMFSYLFPSCAWHTTPYSDHLQTNA